MNIQRLPSPLGRTGRPASRSRIRGFFLLLILLLPAPLPAQTASSQHNFFKAFVRAMRKRDTPRMNALVRENEALAAVVIHGLLTVSLSKTGRAAGRGETRPVAGNETEEGRRLNRRVEVMLDELPRASR